MASSPISIASFPSIQVPGHQARWITPDNWNEADFSYYNCLKRQHAGQILKPPKGYGNKREQTGFLVSQNILASGSESSLQPLAWAEIHLYCHRFSTAFIFYHLEQKLEQDLAMNGLGSLVSMSFFLLRCDQIRLVAVTESQPDAWHESLKWGEKSELFTFPHHPCLAAALSRPFEMVRHNQQVISRGLWDERQKEKTYYQKLSYVENKRRRQDIAERMQQQKVRRRGLIARIFRPKIEDSLF